MKANLCSTTELERQSNMIFRAVTGLEKVLENNYYKTFDEKSEVMMSIFLELVEENQT